MKIEQCCWTESEGWQTEGASSLNASDAHWVLVFGSTEKMSEVAWLHEVKLRYPRALIIGYSTGGEICATRVRGDSLVITAVQFEHTRIKLVQADIIQAADSYDAGAYLAQSLAQDTLVHVLVLSDELKVNSSELVKGLRENLPQEVAVTGGLVGDGSRFQHTLVCADGVVAKGKVVALGFYGEHLKVGFGSFGGWDAFGPERLITKSKEDNILYELDGQSALALYKKYLAGCAAGLPATTLLFPLLLRGDDGSLVRTVLGIDEAEQSMIFVGDMPEGLPLFLGAVSDAYESNDADRLLIERSLDLMSQELTERNAELRNELAERQRAEAQLEGLLSLLGTTLESTADGILALDREAMSIRFNQRFIEMWRVPDEILAFWNHNSLMQYVLGQLKAPDAFMEKLNDLCRHPETECYITFDCTDGRIIELYSMPQPLGMDNVGRVLSFRDITARKQAEEALWREKEEQKVLIRKLEEAHNQLLQSEKMASIGQLAAGVAHEINNPIGYVNSNLNSLGQYVEKLIGIIEIYERAEPDLPASPLRDEIRLLKQEAELGYLKQDIRDLLRESAEGVVRVKQIVQDLKDFSHINESEWLCADLHKGIDSTLNIVHSEIKHNAEVIKEYGAIPLVECMASQLNQVFMNMLVNASHAIGEGGNGRITIRTGVQNETVWIEIGDTGKGIAPEHINKIFDPFFTTKPVGKGTGLGLSLSFGIVKKHHGHIEVQSEVGKGTAFRVWLPVKRPVGEQ